MSELPDDWKESRDTYTFLVELILTIADKSYEMGLEGWTEKGNTTFIALMYEEVDLVMQELMNTTTPKYKDSDDEAESRRN